VLSLLSEWLIVNVDSRIDSGALNYADEVWISWRLVGD
jgi:hypothetical protein